jgi:hypothetical protein
MFCYRFYLQVLFFRDIYATLKHVYHGLYSRITVYDFKDTARDVLRSATWSGWDQRRRLSVQQHVESWERLRSEGEPRVGW